MGTAYDGGQSFLSQNDHTISAAFQIPDSPEEKLSPNLLRSSVLSRQNEAVSALKWATRLGLYRRDSRQWKVSGLVSQDLGRSHESIGQTVHTCMRMCLRAYSIVVSVLVFVISQYSRQYLMYLSWLLVITAVKVLTLVSLWDMTLAWDSPTFVQACKKCSAHYPPTPRTFLASLITSLSTALV